MLIGEPFVLIATGSLVPWKARHCTNGYWASVAPEHRLSFRNLIEMAALRALRIEHEFKRSAVRTALDHAGRELNVTDLLASKDLSPVRANYLSSAMGNSFTSIAPDNSVFRQCCKACCAEFNGTRGWLCASFRHCRADPKPSR
jgi:hypothetical protein